MKGKRYDGQTKGSDSDEHDDVNKTIENIINVINGDEFDDWMKRQRAKENVKNGTPWFNLAGYTPDPNRHSPSKLLLCHRKAIYKASNAPAEEEFPQGVFYVGNEFESLVERFAWGVAEDEGLTVQNDVRIQFEVDRDETYLKISGNTDPVICGESGTEYLLPIEVKTRYSVDESLDLKPHHTAQLHAYIAGLRRKRGGGPDIDRGLVVYVSRQTLDVKVFQVHFDQEFWNEVILNWAEEQTHFRLDDELPPAEPLRENECDYCEFAVRCGKSSNDLLCQDELARGLIPLYDYPSEPLTEYLQDNPAFGLTPTTAWSNKELAEHHGVYPWKCHACGCQQRWDTLEPEGSDGSVIKGPTCPECEDCRMRGPDPEAQRDQAREESDE